MMYTILIIVQVLIAIGLVVLILLQHGKGADAGAAFGSGASSTVFGSQGSASFLTRITAVLAALFFLNSLALSTGFVMGEREPSSVAEQARPVPAPGETAPEDLPPLEQSQPQEDVPSDIPAMDLPADGEPPADDLPQ
ncbi:preprotein translocase subunit SecG [Thiohalobacter thiocyanaticus]|uniref:Protein-export membrane protein SecG n=1 Tax=Thiohalobacter thiocyanaticus TaxID=585455 RepID=A0A426QG43_9GAMM|nr:preprotein translocase subunit SecG [Thiohalobacter thiocyanaticus]RRQ20722.1 preprotein translocase subunit SecG [Thiohalobacter thiocyanaticus]